MKLTEKMLREMIEKEIKESAYEEEGHFGKMPESPSLPHDEYVTFNIERTKNTVLDTLRMAQKYVKRQKDPQTGILEQKLDSAIALLSQMHSK